MKKNLLAILLILFVTTTAIAQPPAGPANKGTNYGVKLTADNAILPDDLPGLLKDKESAVVKVQGDVVDVCQAKGCFIYLKTSTGKIYVKTKDDSFFVPVAINGKKVVVQGIATLDKDDKKISIQATGVLVL